MPMTAEDPERERALLLARAMGSFESFCGLLDIIGKDGKRQKLSPLNDIQRRYCRERTARDVSLKPRQVGFTTMEQARDIYFFLTHPNAQVVVVCQSSSEHDAQKLLSRNYRVMFEGLRKSGIKLDFVKETETEWVLDGRPGRLRILEAGASEAAAEKKGRGGTVQRLHLTETSAYEFAYETLNALLESVPHPSTGSEIISESTPKGAAGYFYEQCKGAEASKNGYKLHFYPWFEQDEYQTPLDDGEDVRPRTERERTLVSKHKIAPERLKWYQHKVAEKGQDLVDQEYPSDSETCFLVSGRMFFDRAKTNQLVEAAQNSTQIEHQWGERVRLYAAPLHYADASYIISLDPSEGVDGDATGGVIMCRETAEVVGILDGQFHPEELARVASELARYYNEAFIIPERNNHGHSVIQVLASGTKDVDGVPGIEPYQNVYTHTDEKAGWLTNTVTRPVMLDGLSAAHRSGEFKTPDILSLGQFRTFVVNEHGKAEAQQGAHDDLVIAHAIAWEVRQRIGSGVSSLVVGGAKGRGWRQA